MIKFGIIANTHGIKGQVKILSNSDFKKQRLKKGNYIYIQDKFATKEPIKLQIESWSTNKNFEILKFVGYDNINDVELFKNYNILVDNLDTNQLAKDEFLHTDLKLCKAVDQNGTEIGQVNDIVNYGAQDCLQIKTPSGELKLVPFIDVFVTDIQMESKTIVINVIDGLL